MTEEIILVIAAAILLIFTVRGYKRGLFGCLFGILSWVFVFLFLNFASPYVEDWLLETDIYDSLYERVENDVRSRVNDVIENGENDAGARIAGLLSVLGVTGDKDAGDNGILTLINGLLEATGGQIDEAIAARAEEVVVAISQSVTARLIHILAIVSSIIIAIIICQFIKMIFSILHDLPVMGTMSRILGATWGFIEGLLVVWVLMLILTLLGVATDEFENPALVYLCSHNAILAVTERMSLM